MTRTLVIFKAYMNKTPSIFLFNKIKLFSIQSN